MAYQSHHRTIRKFLTGAALALAAISVPSPIANVAQERQPKVYSVDFEPSGSQYGEFWDKYVNIEGGYRNNVDIIPLKVRISATAYGVKLQYGRMAAKKDIPDTSAADRRLEALAQELYEDSNCLNSHFNLNNVEKAGRFVRLNYGHKSGNLYLQVLAVPGVNTARPVALIGFDAVEIRENKHYARSANENRELWSFNNQHAYLKPATIDDQTTIPEIDVTGISHKLEDGIKRQRRLNIQRQ